MEAVLVSYTISAKDVAGPFIEKVPSDYREKANLKRLAYTSAEELLAEKFHMSEALLRQLNPGVAFDQAGTEIVVAGVQREDLPAKSRASRSMPRSNVFEQYISFPLSACYWFRYVLLEHVAPRH